MRKLNAALFLIETKSELQEEPLPQAEIVKASDILTETSENRMADWKLALLPTLHQIESMLETAT